MRSPDFNINARGQEPFKVPEGYLEGLPKQIMEAVDRQAAPSLQVVSQNSKPSFFKSDLYAKLKPYIYMAAMIGSIYFGVWVYKYQQKITAEKSQAIAMQTTASASDAYELSAEEIDTYIDEACDYMMIDSHDIMAYVTDQP